MAEDENGRGPWMAVERATGVIVAAPITAGFILLGAGVIVGRSLLELLTGSVSTGRIPERKKGPRAKERRPDESSDGD